MRADLGGLVGGFRWRESVEGSFQFLFAAGCSWHIRGFDNLISLLCAVISLLMKLLLLSRCEEARGGSGNESGPESSATNLQMSSGTLDCGLLMSRCHYESDKTLPKLCLSVPYIVATCKNVGAFKVDRAN